MSKNTASMNKNNGLTLVKVLMWIFAGAILLGIVVFVLDLVGSGPPPAPALNTPIPTPDFDASSNWTRPSDGSPYELATIDPGDVSIIRGNSVVFSYTLDRISQTSQPLATPVEGRGTWFILEDTSEIFINSIEGGDADEDWLQSDGSMAYALTDEYGEIEIELQSITDVEDFGAETISELDAIDHDSNRKLTAIIRLGPPE